MEKLLKSKKIIFSFLLILILIIFSLTQTKTEKLSSQEEQKIDNTKSQPTKPDISSTPSIFKEQASKNNPNLVLAKVVKIVDGDTIDVDLGNGNIKRVRYIGIDTPESVDPKKPVQCFSKEATAKNKELVENGIVGLEKDVSETDRYGRLLRYVYMGDLFVNKVLVSEGYAHAASFPPDIKYQSEFKDAEGNARTQNKGLWGKCNQASPTPLSSSSGDSSQVTANNCKYSCSGPDRDCSDFSSHKEAQDFFDCCGFTKENDPMRLDNVGVGDGIACENI